MSVNSSPSTLEVSGIKATNKKIKLTASDHISLIVIGFLFSYAFGIAFILAILSIQESYGLKALTEQSLIINLFRYLLISVTLIIYVYVREWPVWDRSGKGVEITVKHERIFATCLILMIGLWLATVFLNNSVNSLLKESDLFISIFAFLGILLSWAFHLKRTR